MAKTDVQTLKKLKIGYAPYSADFTSAIDRRRFAFYARARGIDFAIADPRGTYDLVVLNEAADLPRWTEFPHARGRLIYDMVNSYLAVPRGALKSRLRGVARFVIGQHSRLRFDYRKCLEDICRRADLVTCATEEQASDVATFCSRTEVIIDIHHEFGSVTKSSYQQSGRLSLLWEGLPYNAKSVNLIAPVLRELDARIPLELTFVTRASYGRLAGRIWRRKTIADVSGIVEHVSVVPWLVETFAQTVTACDLGIIPLDLGDPFEAGKPENKLVELWRLGMPVLASATPAYRRAMERAGLADMLCTSLDDWRARLTEFAEDTGWRASCGRRALEFVNAEYSVEKMLAKWDRAVARAIE